MSNIQRFQKILKDKRLDGFIVTNPINIFYLCGFRGISQTERESVLVLNPKPTLVTARLYQNEARSLKSKDLHVEIVAERHLMFGKAKELLTHPRGVRIGFEENDLKYGEYQELFQWVRDPRYSQTLKPYSDLIEKMRMVKTADEIAKIEKAQLISQKAFDQIIKTIKVGQTEEEIAERLASVIKSQGGQGLAFESIIASGPNAGIPHHRTGKRKIKKGEVLLLDFGAKFENYHADLSRTIFVGKARDEHKKVFENVKGAQKKALEKIKMGTKTSEAFHFANNHFKNLALENFFTHGLGHGIGLEIHENPYLRASTKDILLENMVFSVEPGLYFPWGGVRIEDLVVIQNGKTKVLGKTVDEIVEIVV